MKLTKKILVTLTIITTIVTSNLTHYNQILAVEVEDTVIDSNDSKDTIPIDNSESEGGTEDLDGDDSVDNSENYTTVHEISYPSSYDYESALKQSYIASQLIRPFETNLYTILLDSNVKSTLTDMYDPATSTNYTLNYRDVYYYDQNGKRITATLNDLISMNSDGTGKKFYIRYEYDTGEVDDDDNPIYAEDDEIVYYTNPYSYFYLTIALSDNPTLTNMLKRNISAHVQMDQYGNIVLNTKASSSNQTGTGIANHSIVIPNFANPELNNELFYLPSRLFLSKYDTSNLGNITSGYSLESGYNDILSYDSFEKKVGKSLIDSGIGAYVLPDSTRITLKNILKLEDNMHVAISGTTTGVTASSTLLNELTDEYKKYLNAREGSYSDTSDSSKYVIFSFGSGYTNYYLNKFKSNMALYANLGDIARNGITIENSSFAFLPLDRLYLGSDSLGFNQYTVKITEDFSGTKVGQWDILMHQYSNAGNISIFNNTVNWGSSPSTEEIDYYRQMLGSFLDNIETGEDSKFYKIYKQSLNIDTETDNAQSVDTTTPELEAQQKTNTVIDVVFHYLTNIGSSSVAMDTSKMSISYKNLIGQMTENYLFHVSNVLEDDTLNILLDYFLWTIVSINMFWFITRIFKYYSGDYTGVVLFLKRTLIAISISLMPLVVLVYFCVFSEAITNTVFRDTFVYWSLVDIDIVNRQSGQQQNYTYNQQQYFRERGLTSYANHGVVEMYGSLGSTKDKNETIDNIQNVLTMKTNLKEDIITSESSLINILDTVARGNYDENGNGYEDFMANQVNYNNSIFYYFYDNFRMHYYRYYESVPQTMSAGFTDTSKGMITTTGTFLKMISDPYFLYGPLYDTDKSFVNKAQDITGLTNLFSSRNVGDRDSYYSSISSSDWLMLMRSNTYKVNRILDGGTFLDFTNPENYTDGIIRGSLTSRDTDITDFERHLQNINNECARELQKLNDYSMYTDESLLFMASMICTMEFNSLTNSYLKPDQDLVPTSYASESYSMDTIFRSMFLGNSDQDKIYQGDLMWAIEEKGGILVQGLVIGTAFIGQLAGIFILISTLILFILACFTFILAYHINKDIYNKAWLGLIGLFMCLLLIHFVFLGAVNMICVPDTSIIRTSLMQGYSNGIRTLILFALLILRTLAVCWVLYFAFKHYRDLGGEVMFRGLTNLQGKISGMLSHKGGFKSRSNSTKVDGNKVDVNSKDSSLDGTVKSDNTDMNVQEARNSADNAVSDSKIKDKSDTLHSSSESTSGLDTPSESRSSSQSSADKLDTTTQKELEEAIPLDSFSSDTSSSSTSSDSTSSNQSSSNSENVDNTAGDNVTNETDGDSSSTSNSNSNSDSNSSTSTNNETINQQTDTSKQSSGSESMKSSEKGSDDSGKNSSVFKNSKTSKEIANGDSASTSSSNSTAQDVKPKDSSGKAKEKPKTNMQIELERLNSVMSSQGSVFSKEKTSKER